jgi:hypothetical protein
MSPTKKQTGPCASEYMMYTTDDVSASINCDLSTKGETCTKLRVIRPYDLSPL